MWLIIENKPATVRQGEKKSSIFALVFGSLDVIIGSGKSDALCNKSSSGKPTGAKQSSESECGKSWVCHQECQHIFLRRRMCSQGENAADGVQRLSPEAARTSKLQTRRDRDELRGREWMFWIGGVNSRTYEPAIAPSEELRDLRELNSAHWLRLLAPSGQLTVRWVSMS